MESSFIETIGFLGGGIVAISLAPQVIKAWKTKSTKDISITWNLIYLVGLILWVIYGSLTQSAPVAIMMGLEALMALSLLILKIRHG